MSKVIDGPPNDSFFQYVGGSSGAWRVTEMTTHSGVPLKPVTHIEIVHGRANHPSNRASWVLRGLARNTRFFTREERASTDSRRFAANPSASTCAALIPIRKSAEWWSLEAEDRQEIIEARTLHIRQGLRFLPAIARRLLHGRDLGEPFDVVTWFEYAPRDARIFDELVAALRSSMEWQYVEREIDIRLERETA